MKKKEIIKKLTQRIDALEKIVKKNSITLTSPDDENKTVFIGIENGNYKHEIQTRSVTEKTDIENITNQPV
ncbi:hypothetical protein [Flavobacterium mesophilum]|uniref:hypothetical protein n=1 Tax=Flavobacterium mesophilum TaxID=3143495 RepID=UPI0031D8DDD9